MSDDRNLTEADVKAIVDTLEQRFTQKFYSDLGKGVWAWIWRAIIAAALFLAAYGAAKGGPS